LRRRHSNPIHNVKERNPASYRIVRNEETRRRNCCRRRFARTAKKFPDVDFAVCAYCIA